MISYQKAQSILEKMWKELKGGNRFAFFSEGWKESFPACPGVYVVWEKGEKNSVYVGETTNLKIRMRDFEDTRNHTLRRTIGKKKFPHVKGFKPATVKKKFPKHIEKKVENYFRRNLTVSYLRVYFGRKELEEYINEVVNEHNTKYCEKKGIRKYLGEAGANLSQARAGE